MCDDGCDAHMCNMYVNRDLGADGTLKRSNVCCLDVCVFLFTCVVARSLSFYVSVRFRGPPILMCWRMLFKHMWRRRLKHSCWRTWCRQRTRRCSQRQAALVRPLSAESSTDREQRRVVGLKGAKYILWLYSKVLYEWLCTKSFGLRYVA